MSVLSQFVCSAFQKRGWKILERRKSFQNAFPQHSERIVRPSEIFVWEHGMVFVPGIVSSSCCDSDARVMNVTNTMLPKRRFWKDEQKMKCGCSMHFSMGSGPNFTHALEKGFEHPHFIFCSSVYTSFQNLRLGSIKSFRESIRAKRRTFRPSDEMRTKT